MRQILRYMYSIVLLCFITSAIVAPVCAEDAIPADEADKFASAREISLLTEDPPVDGIQCFAVSDSGLFALGLGVRVSGTMTVAVYSQDCVFQYGYTFQSSGGYVLDFHGENLVILFSRSGCTAELSPDGKCTQVKTLTPDEENDYWYKVANSTVKERNGSAYQLVNHLGPLRPFSLYYSELVCTDAAGNTSVLYRTSETKNFLILGCTAAFVLCCGCGVFIRVRRSIRKGRAAHGPV